MGHLNQERYIDFLLVDIDSNPIPGRTLADWTIVFNRDSQPCTDPLSLHDYGDGHYTITYRPSAAGHDYVEIHDDVADCDIVDIEDIDDREAGLSLPVAEFNENHGGLGQLRVTESNPSSWALYVYKTSDWATGQRTTADAVGSTLLDAQGNWLRSVFVLPGTYNIVIRSSNTIKVIAYGLVVLGETDNSSDSDEGLSITGGTGIIIYGSGSKYTVSLKIPVQVPHGGTGLISGVSGGVLAFTSSGVLASSAELTANAVVLGGGAGAAPTVVSWLGALNQVLTSQGPGAPPIWGDVLSSHDLLSVPHTDTDTSLNPNARGDLLVVNSALKWERFPKGTAHQLLAMGESATIPEWTSLGIGMTGDGTVFSSSVPGSPITEPSGTFAPALCLQSAGRVFAGPCVTEPPNSPAKPTFRALEWPDLPDFPVFGLPHGGIGITSGTNGGILGFTATDAVASSALLTAHGVVLGGGAGATPTALSSLGTVGQVLTSGGAGHDPLWSQQNTIAGCVGYEPSMGGGLTLNIGPGQSFLGYRNLVPAFYYGGTLEMYGGTTTYVYLSPTNSNYPTRDYISGFLIGCIPLYEVHSSSTQIISILDLRDRFVPLNIMTSGTGTVLLATAVANTNANLVLATTGYEYAGSVAGHAGRVVILGDVVLFSPTVHTYRAGFNVFSGWGLYNAGYNLHRGTQYSDLENQQPSSLTQAAYFRLSPSGASPSMDAPLGFANIGVHVDHNPWPIQDQDDHTAYSYPVDIDAIKINLANGAVTFSVNPSWVWPWQSYDNPSDPPLTGVLSTQRVINFNSDLVGGTKFTNAATNRALAIGTGAGTAAWTTAALGAIQGGTGNSFTKFTGPLTVEKTFTLPNATCTILTTNAVVTVAQGGTGITSGTNGGIPGYTASGTLASSVLLTARGIMLGGGAGATPTALAALGNAGEVLTSQGAGANPHWAAGGGGGGGGVNAQTGNYLALVGDAGKLISMNKASAVTLTLPASPPSATWWVDVENIGAGALTVARNSLTIDGAAANLTLAQNQGLLIYTDGSNYFTSRGVGSSDGVPTSLRISTTAPLTGGGDLTSDRTLAISNFVGDSGAGGVKGAVPAPEAGDAAAGKVLGAGGAWVIPRDGGAITLGYLFDTGTSNADPGSGKLRLNNATENAATAIYVNTTTHDSIAVAALLDTLDASTNSVKGEFRLVSKADVTKFLVFNIASRTPHVGYREFALTIIASSAATPFSDEAGLLLMFSRAGDAGSHGSAGQGFTFYGPWAVGADYIPYDVVTKGGQTYECTVANTGNDPVTDGVHWSLWAAAGDVAVRGTVVKTTAAVADASNVSGTVALGKSFAIDTIEVSCACRVRLYSTAALQAADLALNRPATQAPAYGTQHGVILDILLDSTTGYTWVLSPLAYGADCGSPLTGNINYTVMNNSGVLQAGGITVTFTRTLEES